MKKYLLPVLLLALAAPLCRAQDDGTLRSRISRDSILIGDQVEWTLDFQLAPGEAVSISKPGAEPVPGVEALGEMALDTLSDKKGTLSLRGRIILTSFDSGSYVLPPLYVLMARADGSIDTLEYTGPRLAVNTIPIDTATFQPHDIKGQIRYPLTFREVIPWVGLALLVAALVWLLVRWIRLRRQNRDFFGKPVVKDPPHIVALRSLEKTRAQKLWQAGKQKQFYTQVTDALRQYIADRFDVAALEQTSAEMFRDLQDKDIEPELKEKLKDLFTTADFVKFAKHTASDQENENAIPTAIRFVNETYMKEIEKEEDQ
ncbi:MAG: hypothetical protein II026_02255 [Bacteroidales bacterium]|nr:hypothetical protein [Bacteroidales bacterium]MBQ1707872.1 hypothetical protein [Bacteroidales bacterium]